MKIKFNERFRELRKEKGLTMLQLSKEIGYSRSTIGSWEVGTREPSLEALVEVAKYFHVSTDYLLGLED